MVYLEKGSLMARRNGIIWKIISIAIGLIVIVVSVVVGYTRLEEQVEDNTIDIMTNAGMTDMNTEHRWTFEERVKNIERDIALILVEVRK